MRSAFLRLASIALSLSALASCTSFDQHWNGTIMPTSANPSVLLAGKWEGSWQSDSTAYVGNLKAIILPTQKVVAKDNASMQQYHAEFKMTLYDFFSNEHKVV